MYDVNEILTRLRNGEAVESIADEMSNMINLATKTYEDEKAKAKEEAERKAKEEEAKRKAEEEAYLRRATKIADLQDILDNVVDWFGDYIDIEVTEDDYLNAEDLLDSVDKMVDLFDTFDFHSIFRTSETKNGKTTTKTVKNDNGKVTSTSETKENKCVKKISTDDVINSFLNELGLI